MQRESKNPGRPYSRAHKDGLHCTRIFAIHDVLHADRPQETMPCRILSTDIENGQNRENFPTSNSRRSAFPIVQCDDGQKAHPNPQNGTQDVFGPGWFTGDPQPAVRPRIDASLQYARIAPV